jgi:hypothetical protein
LVIIKELRIWSDEYAGCRIIAFSILGMEEVTQGCAQYEQEENKFFFHGFGIEKWFILRGYCHRAFL